MRQEEMQRLSRLLEQDKEGLNAESRTAALGDFLHVAREYFEVNGEPTFDIEKQRHGFEITFRFRADRVKNFTTVK